MAQSNKTARLGEDMKREVISIIQGMKDPRIQGFLTVTRLDVTADLDQAKVFISKLDSGDGGTKEAVAALQRASGHVRSEIAKRMHIRKAPEFVFFADDGAQYAAHINELLDGLKKE